MPEHIGPPHRRRLRGQVPGQPNIPADVKSPVVKVLPNPIGEPHSPARSRWIERLGEELQEWEADAIVNGFVRRFNWEVTKSRSNTTGIGPAKYEAKPYQPQRIQQIGWAYIDDENRLYIRTIDSLKGIYHRTRPRLGERIKDYTVPRVRSAKTKVVGGTKTFSISIGKFIFTQTKASEQIAGDALDTVFSGILHVVRGSINASERILERLFSRIQEFKVKVLVPKVEVIKQEEIVEPINPEDLDHGIGGCGLEDDGTGCLCGAELELEIVPEPEAAPVAVVEPPRPKITASTPGVWRQYLTDGRECWAYIDRSNSLHLVDDEWNEIKIVEKHEEPTTPEPENDTD